MDHQDEEGGVIMRPGQLFKLIAIFFIGASIHAIAFAQDNAPDRKWFVGFDRKMLTAYEEQSSYEDSISNDGYVLSIGYLDQVKKGELPDFFKSLESMGVSFRVGLGTTFFRLVHDPDYHNTHDAFTDNPFVGFNVFFRFLLFENVFFDVSALKDFGRLDNLKHLHKTAGHVYPDRGEGSWDSTEAYLGLTCKCSNISFFLGLNSYQFDYGLTLTDYPTYPSDYDQKGSGGVGQDGVFAGAEYQFNEKSSLGFRGDFASAQTLLEGYQIYAKYIL